TARAAAADAHAARLPARALAGARAGRTRWPARRRRDVPAGRAGARRRRRRVSAPGRAGRRPHAAGADQRRRTALRLSAPARAGDRARRRAGAADRLRPAPRRRDPAMTRILAPLPNGATALPGAAAPAWRYELPIPHGARLSLARGWLWVA